MGFGLIFFGIGLIVAVIFMVCARDFLFPFVCILLPVIFVSSVIMSVSDSVWRKNQETEYVESYSEDIYSLGLQDSIGGNFILGTGSIKTTFVYVYYKKDEDGFLNLHWVDSCEVKVKETNEKTPAIVTYCEHYKNTSWFWAFGEDAYCLDSYKIIYVPEGTIVQIYNINP